MEYKEFLCQIRNCVEELCGNGTKVTLHQVRKNNSMMRDALLIQKEGENISPTIYLDSFYEKHQKGEDVYEIAEKIIEIYEENDIPKYLNTNDFFEYENVKDKIIFKLINADKNKDMLNNVPHRKFYDLAIVYCCFFDRIFGDYATTLINTEHMEKWSISENELYELAYENTLNICKQDFRTMNEIMVDMLMSDDISEEIKDCILEQLQSDEIECPMYVLSNGYKLFGASLIIYEHVMEDIADKIGNFYIIPSSIHEVILIPEKSDMNVNCMLDMVKEVNATQVSYDEVLSDNIYLYKSELGKITLLNNLNEKAYSFIL